MMRPNFALCCLLLSAAVLVSPAALAQTGSFTVEDIRLQGLQRVSAGTVFNALPVRVGEPVDQARVRDIIRSLFDAGYFSDVRVLRDGNVLVIRLEERPAIESISIEGNRLIRTPQLLEGLAGQGLREGEIFRRATLERVGMELERQYVAQGRYNATIETTVEERPRNRVAVDINVTEGRPASIRQINIVGNHSFSDRELLNIMELKHPNLLSFIRNDDKYSREKFAGDLERIESYYLDRGFVQFNIESTQVSLTPDRRQVYLTINVREGEPFEVGNVELIGDFRDIPPQALRPLLVVQPGQTFSRALVTASEERLTNAMGNSGYTFANAQGVPEIGENGKVDIRFIVDAGQRAYVRRIEFRGNTVTQDEVLRREMRQMEGGWASTSLIELSKLRLERLGYFHEVNVETPEVPGTDNQIDVLFTVEEAPSGSISATLGFAQGIGLMLGANYQENNVLGTGNSLALGVDWSRFERSARFNYFNPYYTLDEISRGYHAFYRRRDFGRQDLAAFSDESFGVGVSFGMPLSETQRLQFGTDIERTDIGGVRIGHAPEIIDWITREGRAALNYKLRAGWTSSTLNRALFPTRGMSQGLTAEIAVPGSDTTFYKVGYNTNFYFPLTNRFTVRMRSRLSYGDAYGATSRLPFYEHSYAGGFGSVRGFQRNTLGPRTSQVTAPVPQPDGSVIIMPIGRPEGDPFGGNLLIEGGVELIFPMPFLAEAARSARPVIFFDAGQVFNTRCPDFSQNCLGFDTNEFRYSVGLGVNWLTAMGPMSFSYSLPFNRGPFDRVERFQFELGRQF
jgi:outer membrane protein insertion porin family